MPQSVTIITSVRNCLDETKVFIESLFSHKPTNLDQVIIVDDGSEEETKDFLRSLRGNIRLTRNDKSIGFGPANNLGVEQSQSDWLLFMNNDLVLTRDWAKPFETVMNGEQNLTQLGCLGNVQMDPRTKLIDHAGIKFSKGYPSHFLQGEENPPNEGFSEYLAVTGACFLIRKDLFSRAGGFDSEYKTGFEDIDLCLKLRMLGYRHYTANQSKIWHKRSSTPERNDYQAHNSKVFYGRWGKVMTRLEEWERAHTIPSQQKKKQYSYILEKPESFLFADRDLLIQNFQFHLRNRMWKESEKVLKLLKENFGGDADLILLESQLLRKSDQPSKAKTLLTKGGDESSTSSLLLEEALVTKALGEMTSARRKFLSLAKKGFIPGVCFHHIGECYLDEKKFEDAKKYYKKALVHLPDSFRIWNRLAKVHQELGDKSDEINVLQKTLSLSPQNSSTFLTLFQSLVGIGSWTKAYQLCIRSKGIQIPPGHLLDFSKACIESGDIKFAIISLNKLISKRHDVAEAYFLKGNVMVLLKEFSRAVECYMKALDYREDWPEALSNLYNSKTFLCDWSERKKELENLQAFHETGSILGGAFELAGLYWSDEEESKYAQMRSGKIVADTEAICRRLNFDYKLQKRTKKRIGFLSSDFRNHAVGHQIIALFENLDSEKYELFIYATSPSEDSAVRKRIENISKNFKNLSSFSLVKNAIAIHRDELDLLVDLGGFSRGHNAQLLALRPAVKQAHYLGYASTMGKGLVDYMIADATVIPPSSSKFYEEKVVRMNGCFFPPGDFDGFAKRVKRKEVGLPARGIVFCAFHAAYKIEPEIWGCWMRILKAVPESVLWLKFKPADEAIKNLKADAVRLGVSSKRIILADDLPDREAHLSRMAVADLYLDCPLYNGHASAMDALHAKLPILTVKGNRFCNRVGESFCKNLDLQEMICKDLRKYEEKAIELGLRPSKLLPLRKKIQENAESVLSPIEHTKRFEEALDIILGKPKKVARKSAHFRPKKSRDSVETGTNSLGDFSLVMIRPQGISNWAYNVSMLADELAKKGGATIVIESPTSQSKKTDFSKSVKVLFSTEQSFSQAINHAICEADSRYIFYLDDPLRVLPVAHFIETMEAAMDALCQGKVGILGVCSSMEPHTGCLVTRSADAKKQNVKVAGFFSPSFVLNIDAVLLTGGLRKFGDSMALSVLDLSLRFEKEGYRSSLIETDKIICPAHSGKGYLAQSSKSDLSRFLKLWNRKPSSLKPKYPSKDEQVGETADYQEWIRLCDSITEGDILAFKKEVGDLNKKPLISLVMPVFDPPKKFLIKAIESVISQVYKNWELCIADDASTKKYIRPLLESYANKDSRIKVTFRKTNGHISVASNSAIKLATGQFVAFVDHDDELRPHSLLEVAKVINQHPDAKLIYSDEDKIDEHGVRYEPYFKPDWNPDLLLGQNYISHFSIFEAALLRKLKGLRKGYEGSQDWDLTLRFTEQIKDDCILHVPKILYHWRAIKGSAALEVKQKNNIFDVTEKAIKECFKRRNIKVGISFHEQSWNYPKIKYLALEADSPIVSILIPTKDRIDLLEKCITSILGTIECKNIEIIVVDNESREERSHTYLDKIKKEKRVKLLSIPGKFNYSKLNNLATEKARGEILLLLNNDIEAITKGWFEEMLYHAMRPEIGCVGAKLLYPDGRLQHGGVIVGLGGGAGHSHKFAGKGSRGYSGHLCVSRNVSAVTAACMMVRKEIYQAVGGLDEKSFKVAFNDVDFCLRVEKLGYRNLWTPFAELVHHESASRGNDQSTIEKRTRSSKEIASLQNRWSLKSYDDPHYNPNLTKLSEQYWFSLTGHEHANNAHKEESSIDKKYYNPGKAYRKLFKDLSFQKSKEVSTFLTTGGQSEEMGQISLDFLRKFGLGEDDFLVDVGCGYGRLAKALELDYKGRYLGTDVVPELLDYAKANFGRQGRDFKLVDELVIPAEDNSVNMVCFFSVFTHLLHEQSYTYLKEVKRVLKNDGRVVFSFLDFKDPVHIPFFEGSVNEMNEGRPLNVFMSEGLIEVWAKLLGFEFIEIVGPEEKKSLGYPFVEFGQSIACLQKADLIQHDEKSKMAISLSTSHKVSLLNKISKSHVSAKKRKLEAILPILKSSFGSSWNGLYFYCMPANAEQIHGVVETENISQHEYDDHAIEIIESIGDGGIVLDCGSGRRPTYYTNVVNFDPVAYETTDVVGVGENLPFEDGVFDAVFSLNVLEHVRDPFTCAKEIARVLKPNGKLYCVVPFMSPYHGYPDHYYNMTKSGLYNLFEKYFWVDKQDVLESGHPIHSITWVLRNWADGLPDLSKGEFLEKKVGELIGDPSDYFDESFVKQLTKEKEFDLGATTALWGSKKQVNEKIINPSPTVEFASNQYKVTWEHLADNYESAKLNVTGDADEKQLKESALESIKRINRYLNFKKDDTVLEIGCGIARIGKELAPLCKKWIGCDISSNMLRYAQKRISHLPNTELIELPDCNLSPIPDHAVDIVYCSIVFMHLEEWDRYEYVKEAFRVLKPGGRAYFDNFSLTTNEGWRIFEAHYEMDYRPSQISKSSTKEELKEYLIRSNFVKVNTDTDEPWAIAVGEKIKNTFFIHIPKTGGLFLRECFKEIMLENKFLPESEHDSLSNQSFFCSEHIPFYEAKLKLDNVENHFLFTFLREPYDHLISHISWLGNLNERPDSEKDFFDDGVHELSEKIRFTDFENQAEVKVLVNDLPYCGVKFFDNCFTRYLGNDEIEERVSFEDVEIALANLKNFSFVGSFEQMELSVNKLFTKLGIALSGIDFSRKINSSNPKKISNIELHEPIKKVLFPLVEKDLIIYREAKKRLLV